MDEDAAVRALKRGIGATRRLVADYRALLIRLQDREPRLPGDRPRIKPSRRSFG